MKHLIVVLLVSTLMMVTTMTSNASPAKTRIKFADFFTGETYQVGPGMAPDFQISEPILELSGKTIEILGFMDGILPRDGMHFMLIREPTTQCPFHGSSFDWAAFVPVFLSNPTEYIDGPVRIVGRLDVGKKTDEMGLVSFVRIYDAAITRAQ
jgi:hypothetical protein